MVLDACRAIAHAAVNILVTADGIIRDETGCVLNRIARFMLGPGPLQMPRYVRSGLASIQRPDFRLSSRSGSSCRLLMISEMALCHEHQHHQYHQHHHQQQVKTYKDQVLGPGDAVPAASAAPTRRSAGCRRCRWPWRGWRQGLRTRWRRERYGVRSCSAHPKRLYPVIISIVSGGKRSG